MTKKQKYFKTDVLQEIETASKFYKLTEKQVKEVMSSITFKKK